MVVIGQQLDLMISKVFSSTNDSVSGHDGDGLAAGFDLRGIL